MTGAGTSNVLLYNAPPMPQPKARYGVRGVVVGLAVLALVAASARAAGQARFSEEADELGAVLGLVRDRLAWMPAVAAYKWRHQLPVLDAAREDALLAQTVTQAEALGLDGGSVKALFALQMRLARELQERSIARFREHGQEGVELFDLGSVIRPRLERIGRKLLETLALVQPTLQTPKLVERAGELAYRALGSLGVARQDSDALLVALSGVRGSAMPLAQRIRARGALRVGTTGDYAPFSSERAGALSGVDVELTQRFARASGLNVRFVRTSWPTLMQDYARGAFDLAASGISVTPERSAVARFSVPYHQGGKTAIARCADRARLDSLAEIDQPGVRVIVNPGGTNQAFVERQLKRAAVQIFPDNRAIFGEIARGRADVMITDDVEVELQTRQQRTLCRTTPELFERSDKAWLVQPDPELERLVGNWLEARVKSGVVARTLSRALDAARRSPP